jgi:hypothetical protein
MNVQILEVINWNVDREVRYLIELFLGLTPIKPVLLVLSESLGNPDLIPKRQFIQKKTNGRADARGLTGPGFANRAFVVKE